LEPWYEKAEAELSGDVAEHSFAGVTFSPGYAYPMPKIPPSLFDQYVNEKLANLTDADSKSLEFLGTANPMTSLTVRSLPAARNSQPYRNRRACAGNTSCIPICPIQAKYDATITLNEATNNGAQLIDHSVASEILLEDGLVSGINFITHKNEAQTGKGCVKATIYVIAANGIETPRLLLLSTNSGQPRERRRQFKRPRRMQSDGPPSISLLGGSAGTGIPLSRPPRNLGHRRSLRRSVPRRACRSASVWATKPGVRP
jgi:choline dehydrogenase-like flavoprotein